LGLSSTRDKINPANKAVTGARKRGIEHLLGLRWNASQVDALQLQWTRSAYEGYLSDPYKFLDQRPEKRTQSTVLFRWNHHLQEKDSTLRWTVRGVNDTWGAHSLMAQAEWAMPLVPGFLLAFVVMMLMSSSGFIPDSLVLVASDLSRVCLVLAIAAVGIKTNIEDLLKLGWKPLVLFVGETVFIASFVLVAVLMILVK
jgi:hypothetical protein